jgi:hypothetical protein
MSASDPPFSLAPKIPGSHADLLEHFRNLLGSKERGEDELMPTVVTILDRLEERKPNVSYMAKTFITKEGKTVEEQVASDEYVGWLQTKTVFQAIRDVLSLYWTFSLEEGNDGEGEKANIQAHPPDFGAAIEERSMQEVKDRMQSALTRARDEQLAQESMRSFIHEMEAPRPHQGEDQKARSASVQDLFLDPDDLVPDLRAFAEAPVHEKLAQLDSLIDPYLQFVDTDERDEHTGLRLLDIWRYARCTWSIPQKQTPGRRMRYLVRDAAREYDPIIGIGALGSGIMQLTPRDEEIGWSPLALAHNKRIKERLREHFEGKNTNKSPTPRWINVLREWDFRRLFGHDVRATLNDLLSKIDEGFDQIYLLDFIEEGWIKEDDLSSPSEAVIQRVEEKKESIRKATSNDGFTSSDDLEKDAQSKLYKRKRLTALKRLLKAKKTFLEFKKTNQEASEPKLRGRIVRRKKIRQALKTALRSIKKRRIAGLMDITTCGAIPPYNEVLGGKLVSFLMASPQVIAEYRERYNDQVSVIASRMKGEEVVRSPELVLLSTTSLYVVGSSQYNRLKAPTAMGELEYKDTGESSGHGHIHISEETFDTLQELLTALATRDEDVERPNNRFGNGVNHRMRVISLALSKAGVKPLNKHKHPRLIYLVPLAKNWRRYMMGRDDSPDYIYADTEKDPQAETQALIDFWRLRWFYKRAQKKMIIERVEKMDGKVQVSDLVPETDQPPLFEEETAT